MAIPVIEGTQDSNNSSSSTSLTVTLPSNLQIDEGVVVRVSRDGGTGTVTWPTGWSELYDAIDDDGFAAGAAAYRKIDGTEGSSITVTSSTSDPFAARASRYSGVDFATDPPQAAIDTAGGNTTSHDPPNLSITGGPLDTSVIATAHIDTVNAGVTGYPTGFINTGNLISGATGSQCILAYADKAETGISSTNPGAFNTTNTRRAVNSTIAVVDPGGGGGPTLKVGSGLTRGLKLNKMRLI